MREARKYCGTKEGAIKVHEEEVILKSFKKH
jgi:hypothetical protein